MKFPFKRDLPTAVIFSACLHLFSYCVSIQYEKYISCVDGFNDNNVKTVYIVEQESIMTRLVLPTPPLQ